MKLKGATLRNQIISTARQREMDQMIVLTT